MTIAQSSLSEAIQWCMAGQTRMAGRALVDLLREQPENLLAWWWLANCVENPQHKRDCLLRVLRLDPHHPEALAALEAVDHVEPDGHNGRAPDDAPPAPRSGAIPQTALRTAPLRAAHQVCGQAEEWFNGARAAESVEDYPSAYAAYTSVLEIDNTCPEAWLGKGFAAGMLSTPSQNRVREFLLCLNRGILAGEPPGVTAQQAALRMDPALARIFLDDLLRLCDFINLLAGRCAPAMANIYLVERVQLTDWAYFIGQPLSPRSGRVCSRADLISAAVDAYARIAVNVAQNTRGPRARRELLDTFLTFLLSNLKLSGQDKDPDLLGLLRDIAAEHQ